MPVSQETTKALPMLRNNVPRAVLSAYRDTCAAEGLRGGDTLTHLMRGLVRGHVTALEPLPAGADHDKIQYRVPARTLKDFRHHCLEQDLNEGQALAGLMHLFTTKVVNITAYTQKQEQTND